MGFILFVSSLLKSVYIAYKPDIFSQNESQSYFSCKQYDTETRHRIYAV